MHNTMTTQPNMADLLLHAAEAEECRRSLKLFVKKAWDILEPGTPLKWNWHMDALCEHLQAVYEGQIQRLLINIAPGHTKSTIVSQAFPMWTWTNDPTVRWLCASTSLDLAIRDNRNSRYLVESDWYRTCYGQQFKLNQTAFDMSGDQNMKSYFENDQKGYRLAVSVGSRGIGKRGTHLLIDDPHDPMEGDLDRLSVLQWFAQTWISRLNDQETGAMVIVGQRIHDQDLSGHVLSLGGWEHLNLPEEFEPGRRCVTSVTGEVWKKTDPRKEEGDLLWTEKFPQATLDALKRGLGPLGYAAQYQQRPVPAGGLIYKEKDRRFFTIDNITQSYLLETPRGRVTVPIKDCWNLAVIDLATSTKSTADYFVMETWAITPYKDALLLHILHDHLDFPEQQKHIPLIFQRFMHSVIAVEQVGYQLAMIQYLISRGLPIKPFKPHTDKVTRSTTGSILYSNGKAYHLKNMSELEVVEKELFTFPKAPHDDIADCHAMMALVISTYSRPGLLDLDGDNAPALDTTLSIEQLIKAEAQNAEQAQLAEQEAKEQEQELYKKGGLLLDPFEWAATHEIGGAW